jgi:LGFP repeat
MTQPNRRGFLKGAAAAFAGAALYAVSSFDLAQAKDNLASPAAQPPLPDNVVIGAIRERWLALGGPRGVLGRPVTPELPTPDRIGRYTRFERGILHWSPRTGAHENYGPILTKWEALGHERSWLGYPIGNHFDFPEGGRVQSYEHGEIYWWPDTGAIDLNNVVVHYTGLICFGETDWDQGPGGEDEPYVTMGMVSPNGAWTVQSRIYETDGGDTRPDLMELYRGKPRGLTVSTVIMEHDESNPNKYKKEIQKAVDKASEGVQQLVSLIPVFGPVIAVGVGALLEEVGPDITDFLWIARSGR